MASPRVSINLPVYNGAATLQRQFEAIASQTFTDFQVLVTDNASTDETADICLRQVKNDHRFQYHRNPRNLGFMLSYQRGMQAGLDSEFLIYASCNDQWHPRYLEECVRALDTNPGAPLAYSYCRLVTVDGKPIAVPDQADGCLRDSFDLAGLTPEHRFLSVLFHLNLCTAFYGLIRADRYAENEYVFDLSPAAGDAVFLAALAISGPFIQIPEPLFIRERPAHLGQSLADRRTYLENFENHRSYRPSLPFLYQMLAHLTVVDNQPVDWEIKDRTAGQVIRFCLHLMGGLMEEEVRLASRYVAEGRLHTGFSGEAAFENGQYKYIDYCGYIDILQKLDTYRCYLRQKPEAENLNLARAVCLIQLGRLGEARLALETELTHHPINLKANTLYKEIIRRIPGR